MDRLGELLDVLHPAWHRDALCREYPHLSWFPTQGQVVTVQVAICGRCAVRAECADASVGEPFGVWGGLTATARAGHHHAAA